MTDPVRAPRILLGVSGGIAAYKAAELTRRLCERGAQVRVVMTASARRFVTPLSFQALSGNPVRDSLWDEAAEAAMGHIELARWADRIVIAPASADLIARLAHGLADDLLSTLCLASQAPLTLAPAMNRVMWAHPATRANVEILHSRGAQILGPDEGDQACGEVGPGRMVEPEAIAAAVLAAPGAPLAGRRILVNAGPTFEDVDPVRYLGNRSSGRMGFAIAEAARALGAEVTLVAGPVRLSTPAGVSRVDVRSADQMHQAVMDRLAGHEVFVAAAAVADYRPAQRAPQKIKKQDGPMVLELVRTPDILAEVARRPQRPFLLGFAAETEALEANARAKLRDKGLDMVAANRVDAAGLGFDSERNALEVFWPGGHASLGPDHKRVVAEALLRLLAQRLRERADA
ncbi:MAG TPA: bifunctional phosphopantothenoylcysteine decarboxylase/phosphopantothenate--cysteine ligase CoaBC [Xanthomonadaceae bacterium]|nr:bifunctional phosphopantothenoylcysteine decarboxylase/phosphopantothenate--cysteine ligase CoaBC [Xanthomonadaceae bacterium]